MARRYKKRKKNNSTGRILVAVLLLCIVSALVGFYGVKFVLGGGKDDPKQEEVSAAESDRGEKTDLSDRAVENEDSLSNGNIESNEMDEADETAPKEESEPVTVDDREVIETGVTLYAYQLGSFTTQDNAERFIDDLNEKGESGTIYKGNNYKVLHIVFGNADSIGYFEGLAKSIAKDAFIYKMEDAIVVSCGSGKREVVSKLVEDFADAMKTIGKAQQEFIEFDEGRKTLAELDSGRTKFAKEFAAYVENLENAEGGFADKLKPWYESGKSLMENEVKVESAGYLKDLSDIYLDGLERIEGGLQCY